MAPLPAALDTLRIAMVQTVGADIDVVNRVYFQYGGLAGTPAGLNTLCAGVATDWNTRLAPFYAVTTTLTRVDCEDLSSHTSPVGTAATSHAGSRGGSQLTAGHCAVMRNQIARRYRGGHPRTYLGALVSADLAGPAIWNATTLASLVTAWAGLMGDIAARVDTWTASPGAQHVNVSYYFGFHNVTYPSGRVRSVPTLRSTPVIDFVTNYGSNPNVCSQRRRNQSP